MCLCYFGPLGSHRAPVLNPSVFHVLTPKISKIWITFFSDFSFTGDALLSALKILTILETENKSINELLINYQTYPQVLVNLKTSKDPDCIINHKTLKKYLDEIKSKNSKDQSMVLVRKSGTEKLIRVMVQSKSEKQTNFIIQNIFNIIFDADKLCQKV